MQWETATPVGFPVCMRHNDCRLKKTAPMSYTDVWALSRKSCDNQVLSPCVPVDVGVGVRSSGLLCSPQLSMIPRRPVATPVLNGGSITIRRGKTAKETKITTIGSTQPPGCTTAHHRAEVLPRVWVLAPKWKHKLVS